MRLKIFVAIFCLMPGLAGAVSRGDAAPRVGVYRNTAPASRSGAAQVVVTDVITAEQVTGAPAVASASCRDAYRDCMDEFCLLDESEGFRCACSDNINQSKSLIQEIQKIQEEADKLFVEGVDRAKMTTRERRLIFGDSESAQRVSKATDLDLTAWLKGGDEDTLDADDDIGGNLYAIASEFCADRLEACGKDADMEERLYARQIVQNCKDYSTYLSDLKADAESNKRNAESAVRQARLANLNTTDKYNQGECLLAYRSCIAEHGGCGAHFENCLDEKLLARRAKACEDVLDQCTAVRSYVLQDWAEESRDILAEAAKYADKNQRLTCLARIQDCLEEGCTPTTNSACLTNVKVAAGICPVINECNKLVPGIESAVNDKLAYLRTKFCENDVDACLQSKCGKNYDAPECLGKATADIVKLCPQSMFPSCKNETQFDIIVSSALLQMDYQMLVGCLNQFSEQLGRVCGTDMSCVETDDILASLRTYPETEEDVIDLRQRLRASVDKRVDEKLMALKGDITIAACATTQQPKGKNTLQQNVFTTAEMIAKINAENRAMRDLDTKLAELSRAQDLAKAEKNCYKTYQVESKPKDEKSYSYIRSVHFEPQTRNCHICRMQQVCETGGMSKAQAALQAGMGGLTAGASLGTSASPGWGTLIGAAVGNTLGAIGGAAAGGKKTYCQEIESCEDVGM
ncbi:hypothetical protein HDR63_02810 [bacterium]|nr:hypothetical protein [bacterium]